MIFIPLEIFPNYHGISVLTILYKNINVKLILKRLAPVESFRRPIK